MTYLETPFELLESVSAAELLRKILDVQSPIRPRPVVLLLKHATQCSEVRILWPTRAHRVATAAENFAAR